MLIFTCQRCGTKSREFLKWQHHLYHSEHQDVVRKSFMEWDQEDNLRSLVVYAQAPPPLPSEVLALFHRLEIIVEDFVCWTGVPKMFIVMLGNKEEADRVVNEARLQPDKVCINGRKVDFRKKSDLVENEWSVISDLIAGEGKEKESHSNSKSNQPIVIDLDDDDEDTTANAPRTSRKRKHDGRRNEETAPMEMECSEAESEPELSQTTPEEEDEELSENLTIKTTMSNEFMAAFNSKIKLETETGKDDKKKLKKHLKAMKQKWADIYLGFHDRFWPICFGMGNSIKQCRKNEGYEVTFDCRCIPSDNWLSKRVDGNVKTQASEKAEEFFKTLRNETKCNRKMKELHNSKRSERPLLSLTCHVIISYNKSNAGAELTLSDVKGKGAKKKIKLLEKVFEKLFKKYEMMKIEKFSSSEADRPLDKSAEWNQILVVDDIDEMIIDE